MQDRYEFKMMQSDGTVVIVQGEGATISEVVEHFAQWLLGCTFSPELVNKTLYNEEI